VRAYREILSLPGTLAFCLAGLFARAGGAMVGIGIVLMVRMLYGSYELAGALAAAEALAWAVGTAVLSNWVDRFGQRKIMLPMAIIYAISLGALVVLAGLRVDPIWLLIPCVAAGLSCGSPGALVRARWNHAIADSQHLHTALSLESTLDELTWVIGPVAAAALATMVAPEAALLVVLVVATTGAFIFYSLRTSEPPVTPRSAQSQSDSALIVRIPGVWAIVAISIMIGMVFGSGDVTIVAATEGWGARAQSGLVLGAMSLGSAIAGFSYGSMRWKTPLPKRFLIGILAMGLGVCTLIFAWSPLSLGIAGFVTGFAIAPTLINTNALIQQIVPESRLTEGLAWIGTALGVGVSIGTSAAGWLIENVGFRFGFVASIAAVTGAVVLACAATPLISRAALKVSPTLQVASQSAAC
jgi:MFS family permease